MELCVNIASYKKSEGEDEDENDLLGNPYGEPYVVKIESSHQVGGWIPVSVMLYADSEEDAEHRILTRLREIVEKNLGAWKLPGGGYQNPHARTASRILEDLESGDMEMNTEKFDKRYLTIAPWAGNTYLV